jgi:dTDP-4-amino-4,6-dideoxygalactose transaminase
MTNQKNIQISLPSTGEEEWQALHEPIATGWLTQGPKVAEFEQKFAQRHQISHAIATTSCTTSLHLILAAMNIGVGDEVIVPAFTWVATANVVLYCGAKPIFVDVDPITFNIDPKKIAAAITDKTKAIIAVHLFGLCANIDEIKNAAPGIPIIEDAACAAGATYKGESAGSLGIAAAFSFHPRKSITTGEGGMVTTNNSKLAERMSIMRNHGASISEEQRHQGPKPYILPEFNLLGYNYRMTDLQGAVGIKQLEKLDKFINERQKWAEFYIKELGELKWLRMPYNPKDSRHGWQSFVTFVDNAPLPRNEIMEFLQQKGISTRPGTHAVHMLGYYRDKFGLKPDDYPGARDCDHYSMAIPLHNRMTAEDYEYVAFTIKGLN